MMSRDYLNEKPLYVFNSPNHETPRDDMTYLVIKIGIAAVTVFLMLGLMALFVVMALS